jgi:hypothetical protein
MTHKEAGHDDEEDDFLKTRARVELRELLKISWRVYKPEE